MKIDTNIGDEIYYLPPFLKISVEQSLFIIEVEFWVLFWKTGNEN